MRNPLNKRFKRELKGDMGKYIAIFLFLVFFIGAMSGFFIADDSVMALYNNSHSECNVEDGHISFNIMPSSNVLDRIEKDNDLTLYSMCYKDETMTETNNTIRLYVLRDDVNQLTLHEGNLPKNENEIVFDRLYLENNELSIGDTVSFKDNQYRITGIVSAVDYSCLFEKSTDMMFDSINFGLAFLTDDGYNRINNSHEIISYAYKYNNAIIDETDANEKSEKLINSLESVIKDYDEPLVQKQVDAIYDKTEVYGKPLVNDIKAVMLKFCDSYSLIDSKTASNLGISVEKYQVLKNTIEDIEKRADEKGITFGDDENVDINSISEFRSYINDISFDDFRTAEISLDDYNSEDAFNKDFDETYNLIVEMVDAIDESGIFNCESIYKNLKGIKSVVDNAEIDDSEILMVKDYVPGYKSQAINFVKNDSEGDSASALMMLYIIIAVIAFMFAITTSNTITKEAGSIGTLRASGYSRGELVRHYLVLPLAVTLIGALIGNLLGYTLFANMFKGVYYSNYSLPPFKLVWSSTAFIKTTVGPLAIILIVNIIVLAKKLRIAPLNFIRGELKRNGRKRVIRLPKGLPLMSKFRLRIFFQNIPSYLVLFFGIFLAGMLAVFGFLFGPLLDDYGELVKETQIAPYQYIIMDSAETNNEGAEKFCLTELNTTDKRFLTDSVSVYGINSNSKYINSSIPSGKVLVSNGMMDKFSLTDGDEITLQKPYSTDTYTFVVAGSYTYDASIAIFMNKGDYLTTFNEKTDYFTGYFSNEELTDIDDDSVATVITLDDLTKVVTQMEKTMLGFMDVFKALGVFIFLLIMYILTKQIIERNAKSISMTKILGFTDNEIARLYLVITSLVVLVSLLLSIPLIQMALHWMFKVYIYKEMTGYIPYIVSNSCYVKMVLMGVVSYAVVAFGLMFKIKKMPKGEALKNQSL